MGDGITTPFDIFVFVLIFYGVPVLVLAAPAVLLTWMVRCFFAARRRASTGRG